ncbi:MAG: tryptophan--tRNA ligase [bacterium]
MSEVVVSGMRPTGPLHLGHYFGVLENWKQLQEAHNCYFFIADWHALTTNYDRTEDIEEHRRSVAIDWLASGIDPDKSTIFLQSDVPEHAQLHLLLEMITPEGWLKRNPTYKDAQEELGEKRTRHVGFLSYPVLQTADVLAYKGTRVPVGEDQKPHLEIGRRIVRRFNDLYGADLPEMEAFLNESAKLLGLDGRKMSNSYDNCIYLSDSPEERKDKIMGAKTDRGPDPGDDVPDEGPVANLFRLFELVEANDVAEEYREEYRAGEIQYGYMKQDLAEAMNDFFSDYDERRRELESNPKKVDDILDRGRQLARDQASETLRQIREQMGLESEQIPAEP